MASKMDDIDMADSSDGTDANLTSRRNDKIDEETEVCESEKGASDCDGERRDTGTSNADESRRSELVGSHDPSEVSKNPTARRTKRVPRSPKGTVNSMSKGSAHHKGTGSANSSRRRKSQSKGAGGRGSIDLVERMENRRRKSGGKISTSDRRKVAAADDEIGDDKRRPNVGRGNGTVSDLDHSRKQAKHKSSPDDTRRIHRRPVTGDGEKELDSSRRSTGRRYASNRRQRHLARNSSSKSPTRRSTESTQSSKVARDTRSSVENSAESDAPDSLREPLGGQEFEGNSQTEGNSPKSNPVQQHRTVEATRRPRGAVPKSSSVKGSFETNGKTKTVSDDRRNRFSKRRTSSGRKDLLNRNKETADGEDTATHCPRSAKRTVSSSTANPDRRRLHTTGTMKGSAEFVNKNRATPRSGRLKRSLSLDRKPRAHAYAREVSTSRENADRSGTLLGLKSLGPGSRRRLARSNSESSLSITQGVAGVTYAASSGALTSKFIMNARRELLQQHHTTHIPIFHRENLKNAASASHGGPDKSIQKIPAPWVSEWLLANNNIEKKGNDTKSAKVSGKANLATKNESIDDNVSRFSPASAVGKIKKSPKGNGLIGDTHCADPTKQNIVADSYQKETGKEGQRLNASKTPKKDKKDESEKPASHEAQVIEGEDISQDDRDRGNTSKISGEASENEVRLTHVEVEPPSGHNAHVAPSFGNAHNLHSDSQIQQPPTSNSITKGEIPAASVGQNLNRSTHGEHEDLTTSMKPSRSAGPGRNKITTPGAIAPSGSDSPSTSPKRVATGTALLEEYKDSFNDSISSENPLVSSPGKEKKVSKWSVLKDGIVFINKTKRLAEDQRWKPKDKVKESNWSLASRLGKNEKTGDSRYGLMSGSSVMSGSSFTPKDHDNKQGEPTNLERLQILDACEEGVGDEGSEDQGTDGLKSYENQISPKMASRDRPESESFEEMKVSALETKQIVPGNDEKASSLFSSKGMGVACHNQGGSNHSQQSPIDSCAAVMCEKEKTESIDDFASIIAKSGFDDEDTKGDGAGSASINHGGERCLQVRRPSMIDSKELRKVLDSCGCPPSFAENMSVVSEVPEYSPAIILSPLKFVQLNLGPDQVIKGELAVSIHGLSDGTKIDDDIMVHPMRAQDSQMDAEEFFASSRDMERSNSSRGEPTNEGICRNSARASKPQTQAKATTRSKPTLTSLHNEKNTAQEAISNSFNYGGADQHDSNGDLSKQGNSEQILRSPKVDEGRRSSPSQERKRAYPSYRTDDNGAGVSKDIVEEYARVAKELDESRARTELSRMQVRALKQEIQKEMLHYEEVERRREVSVETLDRSRIVLKRMRHQLQDAK